MTRETWHSSLESVRRRFESAAMEYDDFSCALFDWGTTPVYRICRIPLPPYTFLRNLGPNDRQLMFYRSRRSNRGWVLGHREQFYSRRYNDLSQNQPGPEGLPAFERCASDAIRCLGEVPDRELDRFAGDSLKRRVIATPDHLTWLWMIFELAWHQLPNSSRHVSRCIWGFRKNPDLCDFEAFIGLPYDRDEIRRWIEENPSSAEDLPNVKRWASKLPNRHMSEIPQLFSWSIWAINLLLSHQETSIAIRVNLETNRIAIDDDEDVVLPHHARIVHSLVEAKKSGQWYVTGKTMVKLPACHGKNISREMTALKDRIPRLKDLIVSDGPLGYRLSE